VTMRPGRTGLRVIQSKVQSAILVVVASLAALPLPAVADDGCSAGRGEKTGGLPTFQGDPGFSPPIQGR
jgi:hypothetical protein